MQVLKQIYPEPPSENRFSEVTTLLQQAVEEGVAPGIVTLVAREKSVLYLNSVGSRSKSEGAKGESPSAMSVETVFDIASLTASVVTATVMMKLIEAGKVRLEDKAVRFIQGFGVFGKSQITIEQLLHHTSGLAAWAPYYEELLRANSGERLGVMTSKGAREYILNSIIRSHLKYETGTKQVYSDLGLILLGHLIETFTGAALDKVAYKLIIQPLGLKSTSYVDLSMIKRRGIHPVTDIIAPTEDCPWRKRVLCGEVHDDNAWAMGGIAGHSGLFSTAKDLHVFASEMLSSYRGHSDFLRRDTIRRFWDVSGISGQEGWRLGWDAPSSENGMAESGLSRRAVGMNGFTGCSLWIEPEQGIQIIVMSNRVNPTRSNKKMLTFRPRLHAAILQALSAL
ncbi:MAG: serine hydrolase [Deltaproteobacteria bacterium]|nr:serine hydrolase [Deltaproteobacteria bacterium]